MASVKTVSKPKPIKDFFFKWKGKNKSGRSIEGELLAANENIVRSMMKKQGVEVKRVSKKSEAGKRVSEKDIALFTRQLSTMLRSGVPLLQSFEIVGRGHDNPAVARLLLAIKSDIESGTSLSGAFKKYPLYFDTLYCNLIEAGEAAGILETLLDRLATYKEKTIAIKGKIKSALFYPVSIIVVAFIITAIIMIFVIPAFKDLFSEFGSELPLPTLVVMNISDFFVKWWWAIFGIIGGTIYGFLYTWKRNVRLQSIMDHLLLQAPLFGSLVRKASIARWSRTLATMFAAGVPLVDSFDSVAGAAGNAVYYEATKEMQSEIMAGSSVVVAMQNSGVFPSMVTQMVAIGEESGSLDSMLSKVADFYEEEVDNAVESLSSLMEPIIMAVLGVLIGGMVIAMYLPIFKMGAVV